MTITINTDTVYSRVQQMGVYAFYLHVEGGRAHECGPLRELRDRQDLPCCPIAKALELVLTAQYPAITRIAIAAGGDVVFGIDHTAIAGTWRAKAFAAIQRLRSAYPGVYFEFRHYRPGEGLFKQGGEWCSAAIQSFLIQQERRPC